MTITQAVIFGLLMSWTVTLGFMGYLVLRRPPAQRN
jgi:hypothetical protein